MPANSWKMATTLPIFAHDYKCPRLLFHEHFNSLQLFLTEYNNKKIHYYRNFAFVFFPQLLRKLQRKSKNNHQLNRICIQKRHYVWKSKQDIRWKSCTRMKIKNKTHHSETNLKKKKKSPTKCPCTKIIILIIACKGDGLYIVISY